MKPVAIQFFSPSDNTKSSQQPTAKQTRKVFLTGSISATGKLILSHKTVDQLALDPTATRFKIGMEQGKRKIKSLYLIPTQEDVSDSFELVKKTNSYSITLALILQKGGVEYQKIPYVFTIHPFAHEDGVTGYELRLNTQTPKPAYTGKPRGRRAKNTAQTQPSTSVA
ncbi:hypothetical protein [Spirosoma arcticum]